jgi:hypothetical protein
MINKPTIIITSTGRTATVFFAVLFKRIIDNVYSVHEAERIMPNIKYEDVHDFLHRLKYFGLLNVTLKKMVGEWGVRSISDHRIAGSISPDDAAKLIYKSRSNFIESLGTKFYMESSYHYYGVVDIIPKVFSRYKIGYIIRDGRDWVRSMYNHGVWYSKTDIHSILNKRLNPHMFKNDPYTNKWANMSRFAKLCWAWNKINQYALKTIEKEKYARLFLFEELFDNYPSDSLTEMVEYLTYIPKFGKIPHNDLNRNKINKKINVSKKRFPHWHNWTAEYSSIFKTICGELMHQLNYYSRH